MDILGLSEFVLPKEDKINGSIKNNAEDFKVTEVLDFSNEPPAKKAKTVIHEELSDEKKKEILDKINASGIESTVKQYVENKTDKTKTTEITDFVLDLGSFEDGLRRSAHQLVNLSHPYLVTETNGQQVSIKVNLRTFIDLVDVSNYETACQVHRLSILKPDEINVRDEKFGTKDGRRAFVEQLRRNKLLDFKFNGDVYSIWIKPKVEKIIYLAKIWRKDIEQNEMISILARGLKIKTTDVSYAGTKDARAEIIQYLTIACLPKTKLEDFDHPKIKILSYENSFRHLQVGELKSNIFEIRIDGIGDQRDIVISRLKKIQQNGFINYFGLQRFGLRHKKIIPDHSSQEDCKNNDYLLTSTPTIGLCLILGDWKRAAKLALSPDGDRDDKTRGILETLNEEIGPDFCLKLISKTHITKCVRNTVRQLHPGRKLEIQILESISKIAQKAENFGTFWRDVWTNVGYRIKQFQVQSANSLLWNRVLNRTTDHEVSFIGNADDKAVYFDEISKYLDDVFGAEHEIPKVVNIDQIILNLKSIALSPGTISGKDRVAIFYHRYLNCVDGCRF